MAFKALDLLSSANYRDMGASPEVAGIRVNQPWGEYCYVGIMVPKGWYELTIDGRDSVLEVVLRDQENFQLVELSCDCDSSSFVHLSEGTYDIVITCGIRPGFYRLRSAQLRAVPALKLGTFFAKRFFRALTSQQGRDNLFQNVRNALFGGANFGVTATGCIEQSRLGRLTAQDLRGNVEDGAGLAQRLLVSSNGPTFFIKAQGRHEVLDGQHYRQFTLNTEDKYDYVVVCSSDEVLTPDALLILAEFIIQNPASSLILCDKWVADIPTTRVAWDPFLYNFVWPTPYAHKACIDPDVLMSWSEREAVSVLSVPLAKSDRAPEGNSMSAEVPSSPPPCTVIIPTRDRSDLLSKCLEGLYDNTDWPHEVIVVDNGSVEEDTLSLFEVYKSKGLRVIRADIEFNFSRLCNIGVVAASNAYIVFLNNDVILHRSDWLTEMMALAIRDDVGAVGAKLLFADGRLQHGGIAFGFSEICGHPWTGMIYSSQADEPQLATNSLRGAVTGACLCASKEKFNAVGGFDEVNFAVTLNDVDLCLKLADRGWMTVFAARAEVYHLEGESRGTDLSTPKRLRRRAEMAAFAKKWPRYLGADIFRSVAYSRIDVVRSLR
ncbi:hypothetical protein AEAC466_18370 [Asticcacaulis sp. AC466]|uniref:glycosyltransferase family 2 protein n=1 Tax=Asticcacaulis sp. AC466 TaxID=1282362 RepID=UPI0003C3D40D|nr:glycosyltransferase family 2 protein [Asticcacaulis sp. AC466]ESQ82313.1 hypothetical protein AEAC466_18370 [Asticcacaulis sp. AC466]